MPRKRFYDDLDELLKDYRVLGDTNTKPLMDEAEILKKFVVQRLRDYYRTYTPSRTGRYGMRKNYYRTGDLLKSVITRHEVVKNNGKLTTFVYFDDKANSRSIWGGRPSFKATLIDKGWRVRKPTWFKNIPHFGFYSGSHFIDKAIKDYKEYAKSRGVNVKVRRKD